MSEQKRRGLGRGIAVLAIVAMGAMVVTPAFSAFQPTKAKVKQIAQKQATKVLKQKIDDVGNPVFIEEGKEIGTFPTTTMSTTDANKTIATFGPFTISMDCSLSGGNVDLKLLAKTSEENSHLGDNWNSGEELDVADGERVFFENMGNAPGGESESEYNPYYGATYLESPSGTRVYVSFNPITNFKGSHCYVNGWFYNLAA